ncbi:MAG: helix-turn-helix domain-containing protein [Chryseobacterium culicis]
MQSQNKLLTIIFLLLLEVFYAQGSNQYSFKKLAGLFDSYSENDERALVFVQLYISKAKKEKNLKKQIEGYEEAIYYSNETAKKLKYGDSSIIVSLESGDADKISRAYLGKGIVYYYNQRNFKKALEEYLKAYKYARNSQDLYQKNKITYHLGMVKYYLGYYTEASRHFKESADYFKESMNSKNQHPTVKQNYESGYFNSIYRLSECYKSLGDYQREDSLIQIGLAGTEGDRPYSVDYAYFQKSKGIQLLRIGNNAEALKYLQISQHILNHKQDVTTLATINFYLGRLYWTSGKRRESLKYLLKVDSIVSKLKFITPEIRSSYEYLIQNAKEENNDTDQLYFTNQLLKADSIINKDFAFLSSKLYREYDTNTLIEERNKLIEDHHKGSALLKGVILISVLATILIIYRFQRKEKYLRSQYRQLLEKIDKSENNSGYENEKILIQHTKSIYNEEIINDVKMKLKIFEDKKQFLKKNIKLPDVAVLIGTNRSTLSYVLNDHLDVSFTQYIKRLRINYITKLLLENNKYLQYNIDGLALECGMSNRQVFSAHFLEINRIRPTDFIRQRLKEIQKKNK